jgi:hypothetical protein
MRRWYLLLALPFVGLRYPPLYASEDRGRADEQDETRAEDYDELGETREPPPMVGAGVS